MRHAMLLNPFGAGPEQAQIVSQQSQTRSEARPADRQATRSTPVCSLCESDDIICHVTAQWSNESQAWELADTFDQPAQCNRCNSACEILWLPL